MVGSTFQHTDFELMSFSVPHIYGLQTSHNVEYVTIMYKRYPDQNQSPYGESSTHWLPGHL